MSNTAKVSQLFQNAMAEGNLSAATAQAINIIDLGEQIQAGLGVSVDDVKASEVVLVTQEPDDSGSIRFAGNAQLVRDGHNLVLDALGGSKQKDGILAHCRYLNGEVLYPYVQLSQAVRMDVNNYNPNQGTPLYDQTAVLLATVLAKYQEFEDNGVACRTVTLIITDGDDEHSRKQTAATVKKLVSDLLITENHIIAAMGIDDASDECLCGYKGIKALGSKNERCPQCQRIIRRTDFFQVFSDMGIRPEWILTPGNTPSEIRKAFQVFSQSAVRASQGAGSFSQTAMGGFGTN